MVILPVRIYGDAVLRKKAKPIRDIRGELIELIEGMLQTMTSAQGVGLAAPQVGKLKRLIVVRADADEDSELHCLINPRIVSAEGHQEGLEGCLSLPMLRGDVGRHETVVVQAMTPQEQEVTIEAEGLFARVLQHEIDHLNGVLFVDKAGSEDLCWLMPDEEEESGYRLQPTTMEEAQRRFARLRRKRQRQEE